MWVHICACMQPRACNHLSTAQGGEGPLPKGIGPGTIWERSRLAAHAGAQLVTQTRRVPYVRLSLTMETATQRQQAVSAFPHSISMELLLVLPACPLPAGKPQPSVAGFRGRPSPR